MAGYLNEEVLVFEFVLACIFDQMHIDNTSAFRPLDLLMISELGTCKLRGRGEYAYVEMNSEMLISATIFGQVELDLV